MTSENAAPAEMPGECEVLATLRKAIRPIEMDHMRGFDDDELAPLARAILAIFAPILAEKERERDEARQIVRDIYWMALRYADGRQTYTPGMCNDALRKAYDAGWLIHRHQSDPAFARDGASPEYRTLEARALAAEAALAAERERGARLLIAEYEAQTLCLLPILGEALKWRRRVTEDLKELIPYVAQIAAPGAAMEAP